MEIKDKQGTEILAVDHLSRFEYPELESQRDLEIDDSFPEEHLYAIHEKGKLETPWFPEFTIYLVRQILPKDIASH